MASILIHTGDESVTLTGQAARRLLERGNSDAALLYLGLLQSHGTVQPRELAKGFHWDLARAETAERVLRELGLIAPAGEDLPAEPADERPSYGSGEITAQLEGREEFRSLTHEVEKRLGKRLSTPDIGVLLELNDYLGLPADVIYLLVCHCLERVQRRFGPGRRPGMKQIQKEGYIWARKGIDSQAAAADYLKTYAQRQAALPQYMRALQLGDREPVRSEEKYLLAWEEMGFPPETVALAYEKTVMKCHELRWAYLNAILKRWHEAGMHTLDEVLEKDKPAPKQGGGDTGSGDVLKYI